MGMPSSRISLRMYRVASSPSCERVEMVGGVGGVDLSGVGAGMGRVEPPAAAVQFAHVAMHYSRAGPGTLTRFLFHRQPHE